MDSFQILASRIFGRSQLRLGSFNLPTKHMSDCIFLGVLGAQESGGASFAQHYIALPNLAWDYFFAQIKLDAAPFVALLSPIRPVMEPVIHSCYGWIAWISREMVRNS